MIEQTPIVICVYHYSRAWHTTKVLRITLLVQMSDYTHETDQHAARISEQRQTEEDGMIWPFNTMAQPFQFSACLNISCTSVQESTVGSSQWNTQVMKRLWKIFVLWLDALSSGPVMLVPYQPDSMPPLSVHTLQFRFYKLETTPDNLYDIDPGRGIEILPTWLR